MTLLAIITTASWLGLLTAVSPCPLATNLAATACLARRVDSRFKAVLGTLCYAAGRVAAYLLIALLLSLGLGSAPDLSQGLQRWILPLTGPLLLLTAMVLLGLLPLPFSTSLASQERAEKLVRLGLTGDFLLGLVFAMSFCPVSAALFFGSLIPLTLASANVVFPVVFYGIGSAAPVALFALVMIFSTRLASRLVGGVTRLQPRILQATGSLLLVAGLYLIAIHTLEVGR
jgi:cytochrome c biogenesis protein CcdA